MSVLDAPARLSMRRKQPRWLTLGQMYCMWLAQERSLDTITPSILAELIRSRTLPPMITNGGSGALRAKDTIVSLVLSALSCISLLPDQTVASSEMSSHDTQHVSQAVVSSAYLERRRCFNRSFIIRRKTTGPTRIPWDTPPCMDSQAVTWSLTVTRRRRSC